MTNSVSNSLTNFLAGAMVLQGAYYVATSDTVSSAASTAFSTIANSSCTTKIVATAVISTVGTFSLFVSLLPPMFR
jgi:hypothetical protein